MTSAVFWGGTGQAKVLREALQGSGKVLVAVFDNRAIASPFSDVEMFHGEAGFEQWERGYKGNYPVHAYAAIGGGRGHDRIVRTRWFKDRGYTTDSIIHRTAFVADTAEIGAACHILAMSATCASVRLGTAVIINTKASVDHDCVLGDGVHIGPGATLAGEVIVRDFAFIGAGATVLPCIQIGRDAIVGAGSVVTHDVPDGTIVVGNPAHFYKKNRV